MTPRLSRLLALGLLALLPISAVQAADPPKEQAENAVRVLKEIMDDAPDKQLPADLLKNARAIAVLPDMVKGGFVFSGAKGEGLISIKSPDGTWSNPNFISMAGAGVGFQIGIQSADVILVFRTDRGVQGIIDGKFTLGANASAAAGPVDAPPRRPPTASSRPRSTPTPAPGVCSPAWRWMAPISVSTTIRTSRCTARASRPAASSRQAV